MEFWFPALLARSSEGGARGSPGRLLFPAHLPASSLPALPKGLCSGLRGLAPDGLLSALQGHPCAEALGLGLWAGGRGRGGQPSPTFGDSLHALVPSGLYFLLMSKPGSLRGGSDSVWRPLLAPRAAWPRALVPAVTSSAQQYFVLSAPCLRCSLACARPSSASALSHSRPVDASPSHCDPDLTAGPYWWGPVPGLDPGRCMLGT